MIAENADYAREKAVKTYEGKGVTLHQGIWGMDVELRGRTVINLVFLGILVIPCKSDATLSQLRHLLGSPSFEPHVYVRGTR